jgi:SlyX protein
MGLSALFKISASICKHFYYPTTEDSLMTEEHLDKLEIKIAYLEDTLNTLNDEILTQAKKIQSMQREIEKLNREKNAEEIRGNEKPPHY